ncbi:AsmA-like C-terminal region-containing protein [Rubripirellula reticaptiva]|uniref:AsmA-like C-terminal region-containing protein n=1 Tax=Rubripirellula reticaptiva TaxID=2528013 RepID=UPI0016454915|nr:AsmA-like C-terminal region-containing protein [Rubripirellula reticaptiva]
MAWLVLLCVVVVVLFRNPLACWAINSIGSKVARTKVDVRDVYLGVGWIQLSGITVDEAGGDDRDLVSVGRLTVESSLFSGLIGGYWLDSVRVDEAEVRIRVDHDGAIVSSFPIFPESSPSDEPVEIPLRSLAVRNASLVIEQTGVDRYLVSGLEVDLDQINDQIAVIGRITNLLGGAAEFASKVDATTLMGSTKVVTRNIRLDSSEWPLSLANLLQTETPGTVVATASSKIELSCPPGVTDWWQHDANVRCVLSGIHSDAFDGQDSRVEMAARCDVEGVAVTIFGNPIGGVIHASVTSDCRDFPLSADCKLDAQHPELGKIIGGFVSDLDCRLASQLVGNATVHWDGNQTRLDGQMDCHVSGAQIGNVPIGDTVFSAAMDVVMQGVELSTLAGNIHGKIDSAGLDLAMVPIEQTTDGKPFQPHGVVSMSGEFHSPIRIPFTVADVVASSSVRFDNVAISDFSLDPTRFDVVVSNSRAGVKLFGGRISDRNDQTLANVTFLAEADDLANGTLRVSGGGSFSPLQNIAALTGFESTGLGGAIDARLGLSVPIADLTDLKAWSADATAVSNELTVAGERFDAIAITATVRQGFMSLPATPIRWRNNLVTLQAKGMIEGSEGLSGTFHAGSVRLGDLASIASRYSNTPLPLSGDADLDGRFFVRASDHEFEFTGKANAQQIRYGNAKIGNVTSGWTFNRRGLTVDTSSDQFLGGRYRVSAKADQADWTAAEVVVHFQDIQANRLAAIAGSPIPVDGQLEGRCQFTNLGDLQTLKGTAWLQTVGMRVDDIPIELSTVSLEVAEGAVAAMVEGGILSGQIRGNSSLQIEAMQRFLASTDGRIEELPIDADIQCTGVSIAEVTRAAKLGRELQPLEGSVEFAIRRDSSDRHSGALARVSVSARDLAWNRAILSRRITAKTTLHSDRVRLDSIDGRFADGELSGKGEVRLAASPTGNFQFGINRVNLRYLAAPLGNAARDYSGTANIRVDGRINRTVTGRAAVSMNHVTIAGVKVHSARLPLDWSFATSNATARWDCRAGFIEAGDGTIALNTDGLFQRNLTMNLQADIRRIDTSKLLAGKSAGAGLIDGRVTIAAKRARSVKDFSGRFDLQLSDVDSLSLPVLDQLPSMIQIMPTQGGLQNNEGHVSGRLSNGLVAIDSMAIAQSNVQVTMTGSATLDGRLDFDVTAATGSNSPTEGLMSLTDSPLMLAAPAPAKLLVQANEAMKNRLINIHVGGNANSPSIQLQPGRQLSQDALRFFIQSQFGSSVARASDQVKQANQSRR